MSCRLAQEEKQDSPFGSLNDVASSVSFLLRVSQPQSSSVARSFPCEQSIIQENTSSQHYLQQIALAFSIIEKE